MEAGDVVCLEVQPEQFATWWCEPNPGRGTWAKEVKLRVQTMKGWWVQIGTYLADSEHTHITGVNWRNSRVFIPMQFIEGRKVAWTEPTFYRSSV